MPRAKRPIRERLMAHVEITPEGCWLWTAALSRKGYAQICVDGKTRSAHKVAYEEFVGPVPPGRHLDHECRIRRCINPACLRPLTPRENTLIGHGPSAVNARKERCEACGSEFKLRADGKRACRTCDKTNRARERARNRELGLCVDCGEQPAPERRYCQRHLALAAASRERRRARPAAA